jgi:hypothetical protein
MLLISVWAAAVVPAESATGGCLLQVVVPCSQGFCAQILLLHDPNLIPTLLLLRLHSQGCCCCVWCCSLW